jgi:hypothetical protein
MPLSPLQLIVVAPTFYSSLEENRYLLALEACRKAREYEIRLFLVDGSPLEEVRTGLYNAGKDSSGREFVRVIPQASKGKKGAALREAISAAFEALAEEGATEKGLIAFQELEKVDMFRHWRSVAENMFQNGAGVTTIRRLDASFRDSYPIEQYYAEMFGNFYLDSLGAQIGLPKLDWTSGPMAFKVDQAQHWLAFDGQIWDAQIVPMIHAHLAGTKVMSVVVDYKHPESMKEEEQGQPAWSEKRLLQLNHLFELVGKVLKDHAKS